MLSPSYASISNDPVDLAQAVFTNAKDVREGRRKLLKLVVAVSGTALLALFFVSLALNWHFETVWRYELAGLFGASVGVAELLSRYRDAPSFVLLSAPGIGYILINGLASVAALGAILAFGWTFGATGGAQGVTQVLVAGFGAMTLFRSSLLTVKAGGDDVGIGPSSVLSIMMAASDRSADRLRAADRAGRVHEIMDGVQYAKAETALPTVAVALMQNLSPADVAALSADLAGLKSLTLPDEVKAFLLGLKITNVVSTAVLAAARQSLGSSITGEGDEVPAPAPAEAPAVAAPAPVAASANGHGNGRRTLETLSAAAGVSHPGVAFETSELPQTPQTPSPDPEPYGRGWPIMRRWMSARASRQPVS